MERKVFEQYQDIMSRIYPEYELGSFLLTFQVTDKCNLACSYCYQQNKGTRRMPFEVAKEAIDKILDGDESLLGYINPDDAPSILIEFIGGEPLLEIDLIDQITEYFKSVAYLKRPLWAMNYFISISTNGMLYFDPKVQKYLEKNKKHIGLSITLDGSKELHDACRLTIDGKPTYDQVLKACMDYKAKHDCPGSKITISPENVVYLFDAIKNILNLGYEDINANVVYEEGWTIEHAKIYYEQLKKITDYVLDNHYEENYISLFEDRYFHPKDEDDLQNWCGGDGHILAVDPDGNLYPCLRYMKSSLGEEREEYYIGNVYEGIGKCNICKDRIKCLKNITRKSQSTEQCFTCPIAEGCSWCSAYNYQINGTPDSRCTFICDMHKARSLANVYYWNKVYRKYGEEQRLKMHCPKDWALEIISEDEYEMLKKLSTLDE